jgi:hypothetical protein
VADNFLAANSTGQTTAPSGLVATLAEEEFASDKKFFWEGDESGPDYTTPSACNSNNNVALCPSCLYVAIEHIPCTRASVSHTAPCPVVDPLHPSSGINSHCIVLSKRLWAIIACMVHASIHPGSSSCFTIADSGATDHMILANL